MNRIKLPEIGRVGRIGVALETPQASGPQATRTRRRRPPGLWAIYACSNCAQPRCPYLLLSLPFCPISVAQMRSGVCKSAGEKRTTYARCCGICRPVSIALHTLERMEWLSDQIVLINGAHERNSIVAMSVRKGDHILEVTPLSGTLTRNARPSPYLDLRMGCLRDRNSSRTAPPNS